MVEQQSVKNKIRRRFMEDEFMVPVELVENAKDFELMISQEMVKILDSMQDFTAQVNFINKLQSYRASRMIVKPQQREQLGQKLTQDGVTYLFAILSKTIQENSGYKEARLRRRAAAQQGIPFTAKHETVALANQLDFQVKTPALINQSNHFSFAGAVSPKAVSGVASSYEYYEESEEEQQEITSNGARAAGKRVSPRSGVKQPDPFSAKINIENQRDDDEQSQRFELYLATVRELYELLQADTYLMDSFKTT